MTARDSGVSQLCRQLLAEALGLRRLGVGLRGGEAREGVRQVQVDKEGEIRGEIGNKKGGKRMVPPGFDPGTLTTSR